MDVGYWQVPVITRITFKQNAYQNRAISAHEPERFVDVHLGKALNQSFVIACFVFGVSFIAVTHLRVTLRQIVPLDATLCYTRNEVFDN